MRQITPGVFLLEGFRGCNVYVLVVPRGVAMIDAGMPGATDRIIEELRLCGFVASDVKAIVLTHCHHDHIGGAAELAERCLAPVLAHRAEVPFIEGTQALPTSSHARTSTGSMRRAAAPGGSHLCKVDRMLDDGEEIEALGGLRVLHTPGHTPGSICLYQPAERVMFCGDLLFNFNPFTGQAELQYSIPQFSVDVEEARRSAQRLLEVPIDTLCCGHGAPITPGAEEEIRGLLGG